MKIDRGEKYSPRRCEFLGKSGYYTIDDRHLGVIDATWEYIEENAIRRRLSMIERRYLVSPDAYICSVVIQPIRANGD